MSEIVKNYFNKISEVYKTWETTEHSYRPALVSLIENINKWVKAINEPKLTEVWRPDLLIRKKDITIWVLEAKDLDVSLDEPKNQEQLKRYYSAFTNFCYTNSLEFRFYKFWELVESIIIAKLENGKIVPIESNFWKLEEFLKDFLSNSWEIIKNSKDLAKIMAWKARLLNETILKIMHTEHWEESNLRDQYKAFKDALVHDITIESFSDMYSQTIVYGLFVARLHDKTLEDFSRAEAEKLIPKSNPFLKDLFHYVAYELEENVERIIDDLVEIYAHSDLWKILEDFWKTTWRNDPVVHFYEDFLWWYNPKTKKSRWVYYTPEPVVNFIIRWIDYLLKTEFGIRDWIASTEEIEVDRKLQKKIVKKKEHRVQILDIATWTWTFLNEIIKHIYNNSNYSVPAMWPKYVDEHLIPRLFGFELLMAPYTMTHLKLWLTLKDTWYNEELKQRLNVYLTNSLEEPDENSQTLFVQSFAREAEKANEIKRDAPIMVITWNPPYSNSSTNKWKRILKEIEDYKKGLNEKKINLDDDYIKFIKLAQHFIDRNNKWVIWMITNNSYIDGVTHRQMRNSLLKSFDKIYIYDLHWSSRKKEVCPDGSKDENVFDIMQWVSIIFAVKTSNKKSEEAQVFHYDSRWKRNVKYNKLRESGIWNIEWTELNPDKEYHFFVSKDSNKQKKYNKLIAVNELFENYNSGIKTDRDSLFYDFSEELLGGRIEKLLSWNFDKDFKEKYRIIDSSSYKITKCILNKVYLSNKIKTVQYRPFDLRKIYYDEKLVSRPWFATMKHMLENNISLIASRVNRQLSTWYIFAWKYIIDGHILDSAWDSTYLFPLYLYEDEKSLELWQKYRPNFNTELLAQIENQLWMKCNQKAKLEESNLSWKWTEFTPTDLFDYIYAVLHSPKYRETYKEFLKINFPRVPFNVDRSTFWYLVEKWRELRLFHLLQHPKLSEKSDIAVYSWEWEDIIAFTDYSNNRVYINGDKYFDNVPKEAWEFYIWWYQPAQRRFKDRKWREMTFDDITHYQKMIISLNETIRLMKLIDMINFID